MNDTTAATRSVAPSTSILWGCRRKGSRSAAEVTTIATAPRGTLMRKIQRQPMLSTKNPPRRGPATLAKANTEVKNPT